MEKRNEISSELKPVTNSRILKLLLAAVASIGFGVSIGITVFVLILIGLIPIVGGFFLVLGSFIGSILITKWGILISILFGIGFAFTCKSGNCPNCGYPQKFVSEFLDREFNCSNCKLKLKIKDAKLIGWRPTVHL